MSVSEPLSTASSASDRSGAKRSANHELDLLLWLVRASLPLPSIAPPLPPDFDASVFMKLVKKTKCVHFVTSGARKSGLPLEHKVLAELAALEREIAIINATNLATVRLILPALADQGVSAVVFKGPLAQREVHGTYFAKVSRDVDILVPVKHMPRARAVLRDHSFCLAPQCKSLWWRTFLREEHHAAPNPALAPVDLHSGLHQPGTAIPRRLDAMLRDRREESFSGRKVALLSEADVGIVAVVSFVKALFNRETALVYLVDLLVWLEAKETRRVLLSARASEQGLSCALELTLKVLDGVFGDRPARVGLSQGCDGDRLRALCVAPWLVAPLRRTPLMWSARSDAVTFLGGLIWRQLSEITRRIEPSG